MRRPLVRTLCATTVALGLAVTVTSGSPAIAGAVHTVRTAPSPSTGDPVAGGGSWIVNKPSGYYVGRAVPGSSFDDELTSGSNWHYGRVDGGQNTCGWVMPGSLGDSRGSTTDTCSAATRARLAHRTNIGRDFNAKAHVEQDGTSVPADPSCTLFYNYVVGSDYATNGGHWADPASGTTARTVLYRFTTRDARAVVVRDPVLGWGFLPIGCVTRPAALYNDDDV